MISVLFIFACMYCSVSGQNRDTPRLQQLEIMKDNSTNLQMSTYKNKDFGFMIDYPSSWIVQEDNLHFNTIAAFELVAKNVHNFPNATNNVTLAEVDIRIVDNPDNITAQDLGVKDIDTTGQVIMSTSNTTLDHLPALKIVDYTFDGLTIKHMQVWTILPKQNVKFLIYYIVQPTLYDQYLPIVQKMLNSFRLSR